MRRTAMPLAVAATLAAFATGCVANTASHTQASPAASTPATHSATMHTTPAVPQTTINLAAACKAFKDAWKNFQATGDLKKYLNRTNNIPTAPDALQGTIRTFNGDLTVYVLAKKHRVSQATILRDAHAILQNCS